MIVIKVSNEAAVEFKKIAAKANNPESQMMRISYGGAGWSGPRLGLALEELKNANDKVVESNGIKIIYIKDLDNYVSGLTLDYSDKWYSKGFRLTGGNMGAC